MSELWQPHPVPHQLVSTRLLTDGAGEKEDSETEKEEDETNTEGTDAPPSPPRNSKDGQTQAPELDVDSDIVLAIPRGGLLLGRAVADALDLPLDIVVAQKMGAPHNPEYAIGAVASDGSVWLDEDAISTLTIDETYLDEQREETADAAQGKAAQYRSGAWLLFTIGLGRHSLE